MDSTMKEVTFQGGERGQAKNLPRRSRRNLSSHDRVSGPKSFPGRSAVLVSLQVWPNLK